MSNVRILDVREGKVTTLGFVTFATPEAAQKAINLKNNADFNGSPLRVMENGPRRDMNNNSGGSGGGSGFQVR